ncbi:MAG: hypothetical protein EXS08_03295 [Planctomycetes bacterium]|nr:hypothetical protein [Planctomycetota bacterium]
MRFISAPPLALALLLALSPGCGKRVDGPNILLITLDTTRRDHLGMYGHKIPTSPNLDRLAQDSLVYTNAYAVSSWTMPTHASIFTGKFPSAHGANYDPQGPLILGEEIGAQYGGYRARPIAEDETTLAQILSENGYATAGIIAGPWMKKRFRLNKGFEHYDDDGVTALNGRPAEDVTRAAIEYVDEHRDAGFFLFLNYYDPHSPWFTDPKLDAEGKPTEPPKPLQDVRPVLPPGFDPSRMDYRTFANICYDAEIRHMDAEIGKLLDHLKLSGLYENTWIIVLADHGELIGEPVLGDPKAEVDQGLWGHGDSLSEPEIHIPFFVKEPGANARKGQDATFVQQVDVLPTILERLGIELPPHVQGRPFGQHHPVVAELYKLPMMSVGSEKNPKDWRNRGDWRVLLEDQHKFGWSSNGTHYLIDLAKDPGELTNLYGAQPERAKHMLDELEGYRKLWPKPGDVGIVEPLSDDEKEALRSLGYTGDDSSQPSAAPPKKKEDKKEEQKEGE